MPYKDNEKRKENKRKYHQSHKEQWVNYRELNQEKIAMRQKRYRELNREDLAIKKQKYYQENREFFLSKQKEYHQVHIDDKRAYDKEYYKLNKERKRRQAGENKKQRFQNDINFRILCNLRTRVWRAMRGIGKKSKKTLDLIGCSVDFLKEHLEGQFKSGMSWENYGKWEIDHIKPCACFDLSKPGEQRECFNYLNLQPLWEKENILKGGRVLQSA